MTVPVPVVAIVGRPNVGKSSLFNWLVGRRISIVDPTAGVTRDRVSSLVEADGRFFELTDTGGIGIVDMDNLTADVEKQIQNAIDQADVVLFVVDARTGRCRSTRMSPTGLRASASRSSASSTRPTTRSSTSTPRSFTALAISPWLPSAPSSIAARTSCST